MNLKFTKKKPLQIFKLNLIQKHDPKILSAIFKGYVRRAYYICSNSHLQDKIGFLIELFNKKWLRRKASGKYCKPN